MALTLARNTEPHSLSPTMLALVGPVIKDRQGTVTPTTSGPIRYAQGRLAGYRNPTMFALDPHDFSFDDRVANGNALTVSGPQRLAVGRNSRINYMRNPSFETNTLSWASTGSGVGTRVPSDLGVGSWALEIAANGSVNSGYYAPAAQQGVTLPRGTYTLSFYVKHISGSTAWNVRVEEANAAGGFVNAIVSGAAFTPVTNAWTRVSMTFTPIGNDFHRFTPIFRESSGAVGVIQIDNVLLELASSVGEYFDGSTANCAWVDPNTYVVGTAHATQSISNPAIYSEESTANLIPNPSAETNTTGWTTHTGITLTRDTTAAYLGSASFKVVNAGTNSNTGIFYARNVIGASNGQTLTASAWVRGSGTVRIGIEIANSGGSWLSSHYDAVDIVLANEWKRISYTTTINNASTAFANIIIFNAGLQATTWYADAIQLEQKGYATSYADGSLGTGYSWSSTAHASSSTRADATISTQSPGRVNPLRGSLAGWVKRSFVNGVDQYIFVRGAFNGDDFILLNFMSNDSVRFYVKAGTAAANSVTLTGVALNTWNFVYAQWTETAIGLSLNGGTLSTTARTTPIGSDNASMWLGTGTGDVDGAIDNFAVFDQPLTSADITNLYNKSEPWSLTALPSFSGQTYEATPRINLFPNPSYEVTSAHWGTLSNATLTRVADTSMGSSFAAEVIADPAIATNSGIRMSSWSGLVSPNRPYTVSFDAYLVSGANDWQVRYVALTGGGATIGGAINLSTFTPTATPKRFAFSFVPTTAGIHGFRIDVTHVTASASTIRIDNVVVEEGWFGADIATYFDPSNAPAAWVDPHTYVEGTAHASPSVSHVAPFVEEGTTNLITNPSAETNTTGWIGPNATLTRDTTYAHIGNASFKVVTQGTANNEGLSPSSTSLYAATQGQTFTFSAWIRGSGTLTLQMQEYTNTSSYIRNQNGGAFTATDQWTRYSMTYTIQDASCAYVYPKVVTNVTSAVTFYIDSVQLEQKSYATTYCDGSLGSGYSWQGTAHASASTRAYQQNYFPVANHLRESAGTMAAWVKFLADGSRYVMAVGNHFFGRVGGTLRIIPFNQSYSTTVAIPLDTWVHLGMTWNNGQAIAYVNGVQAGSPTTYTPAAFSNTNFSIILSGSSVPNGPIDGTVTFDRALSASEMVALASTRNPMSLTTINSHVPQLSREVTEVTLYRERKQESSPVLFHYGGNALSGSDRNGAVAGTASGAMRYQPFNGARINLAINPRFGTNTSGWATNGGGTSSITRISTDGVSAQTCVEVVAGSDAGFRGLVQPLSGTCRVTSGTTYTVSVWAKSISGSTSIRLGANTYADDGSGLVGQYTTVSLTTSWKRYSHTFTVAAGKTRASLGMDTGSTPQAAVFRATDWQLELGSAPTPYFDGSIKGMWLDPVTGIAGASHASPSVSHAVPWIEEGTTNYLPNPSSETDIISWAAVGTGVTFSQDNAYAYYGTKSLKVVGDGSTSIAGVFQSAAIAGLSAGQTWTASVWVRGTAGTPGRLILRENIAGSLSQTLFTFTDQWQRVVVTRTLTDASLTSLHLRLDTNNNAVAYTAYVDGAQLEQKAYATSYCDGSLGNGYAWSSTAHASSSTRTASALTFPNLGHLDTRRGTVLQWAKFPVAAAGVNTHYSFFHSSGGADNRLYLQRRATGALAAGIGSSAFLVTDGATTADDTWVFMALTWDGSTASFYKNGARVGSPTAYTGFTEFDSAGTFSPVGHLNGATNVTGSVAGPTMVFDRVLTASEISAYYANPSTYGVNKATAPSVSLARATSPVSLTRQSMTYTTPALAHIVGNDLTGTDRNGSFAITSSGPLRVQPANGARINYLNNPRFFGTHGMSTITGWGKNSGNEIFSVLTDDDEFGNALQVTSPANVVGSIYGHTTRGNNFLGYSGFKKDTAYTFSIWARIESGPHRAFYMTIQERNAAGNAGSAGSGFATLTTDWQRFSFTRTLTDSNVHNLLLSFGLTTSGGNAVSTTTPTVFRVAKAQVEEGSSATPYFDGSFSGAAWADPISGVLGTSHNSPSFSQAAYWVEEATTNLLLNPSVEGNPAVGRFGVGPVGGTIGVVNTHSYVGTSSWSVTSNGSSSGHGIALLTASGLGTQSARTFTAQARVRGTAGVVIRAFARAYYTDASSTIGVVTDVTLTDGWQLASPASITTDPAKTLDYITLFLDTKVAVATTFYVDAGQIEEKAYATSYCDGSLGTGYSWQGTAHASSSTRVAGRYFYAPTTNQMNSNKGSIIIWYNRFVDISGWQSVFSLIGTNDRLEAVINASDRLAIYAGINLGAQTYLHNTTQTTNAWYFLYVAWDGANMWMCLNNEAEITLPTRTYNGILGTSFGLGSIGNGTAQSLNGVVGPMLIFDRPLTAAERTAYYQNPSRYGFNTALPAEALSVLRVV